MAYVVCFPDGSTDTLLSAPENRNARLAELEGILRERLGDDFTELLAECYEDPEPKGDDYEAICDGYRACLQDALAGIQCALRLLGQPRINRKTLVSVIKQAETTIINEL